MIKITRNEFFELAGLVRERIGINLKEEKIALVEGRLSNILQSGGYESFGAYFNVVRQDKTGELFMELIEKITTNHTYFLREKEHFDYLESTVIPRLCSSLKDKEIRIWSAGCSTGEEPYTIAMKLMDYFWLDRDHEEYKILATDISRKVLKQAYNGIYLTENLANIPEKWKKVYFEKVDEQSMRVCDSIKELIVFRNLNLKCSELPFKKKFHIIFCRNVMIYFDKEMKKEVVQKFYDSLEPGGYLFIGHSETINDIGADFDYIRPAVYRKRM